jgi:hypothetical protein
MTVHPDAAEFAGIRADLARLFIAHKADMGMGGYPDAYFVERTNDVTAVLWVLSQHAIDHGDWDWLRRHRWWIQAAIRLHHGEATTALDG